MSDNGMKWYTIHVYSSMEKSVKKALEERIGRSDLRESFGQVLLPVERVQEVRNGRKYTSERRMYPGYVFIEMVMNDATWHLVNSTPRVIEFLGNNNPVVLSEAEVASIMAQMEQAPRSRVPRSNSRSARRSASRTARSRTSTAASSRRLRQEPSPSLRVHFQPRNAGGPRLQRSRKNLKKFWRVACTPIFSVV